MKQKPASHTGSLANLFIRQTASIEGRIKSFVTLPKLLGKAYTKEAITGVDTFRNQVVAAKKFVLSEEFMDLVNEVLNEANSDSLKLKPLWQFAMPPFDPCWFEFWDSMEGIDTGLLIDSAQRHENAHRIRMVFQEEGGICVAPPIGMLSRFHGEPFDFSVREAKEFFELQNTSFTNDALWMAQHVRPLVAHKGGLMFKNAAQRNKGKNPLWDEQGKRAMKIGANGFFQAMTIMALLSLAPIRHLVQTTDSRTLTGGSKEEWRWKHDHKIIELIRPITVREVHVHVRHLIDARKSPAMHEVMGFWRVRGGYPHCTHIWHPESTKQGTDTHLGRPHRTDGITRLRCSKCSALRSWVHSHTRGDATQGVISKEFTVIAPGESGNDQG